MDLRRVFNALSNYGVWGDFALFHETATGRIYVFDPDNSVGNGTRNPVQIVRDLVGVLNLDLNPTARQRTDSTIATC